MIAFFFPEKVDCIWSGPRCRQVAARLFGGGFFFGGSVGCHLCRQFTQLREERSVTDCRILKRKFHFMFQHLLLKIALCCTSFNLRPAAKCTFCAICDTISKILNSSVQDDWCKVHENWNLRWSRLFYFITLHIEHTLSNVQHYVKLSCATWNGVQSIQLDEQ